MRLTCSLLCAAVVAAGVHLPAQSQGQGLSAAPDALGGPAWQARFERDAPALAWLPFSAQGLGGGAHGVAATQGLRLFGDYQFSTLRLGETGGLRLTGGLLIHLRTAAPGAPAGQAVAAQPYAGLGYASGSLDGRWGFSADLGLAASRLSPAGAGSTAQDLLPRLLPMVRLGMNLAF